MAASTLSTLRPLPLRLQPGHASRRVPVRLSLLSWSPLWRWNGWSLGIGKWDKIVSEDHPIKSLDALSFLLITWALLCNVWSGLLNLNYHIELQQLFSQVHSIDRIERLCCGIHTLCQRSSGSRHPWMPSSSASLNRLKLSHQKNTWATSLVTSTAGVASSTSWAHVAICMWWMPACLNQN